MTEDGLRATKENGGHPAAMRAHQAVPDGVDATVHDIKAAPSGSSLDLSVGHAERDQLPTRDHAMLSLRQPGNVLIPHRTMTRAPFSRYRRPNGARFCL